jgi:nitrate/TMAO reductase-like tetraheme cytochrome c subunit
MRQSDLTLDGNAVGGLLMELFGVEMTVAEAVCASCGRVNPLARVVVYMNAPGVVARCPDCGQVAMRIVRGRGRVWLDMSGIRCLACASPGE